VRFRRRVPHTGSRAAGGRTDQHAAVPADRSEQGDAVRTMPQLSRVGGSCPCSNAVRWVMPEGAEDAAAGTANGAGARAN